jgi:hypothetical protein
MTLYNQLKHSGNPQAAIQTIIYLLDKHSPKQVAEIMGISVRWVYTIRKRFLSSGENLSACLLKRGPKNPMPNRTPHYKSLCSLGWGVIPGTLPLFARGLPSTSLMSMVISMGGALVI